ncbi:MAG: acyltransferase family protein [Acidimicrobiales bacterium]|nr:acyltransferase family protein [Acidimicrobiales bacterium]
MTSTAPRPEELDRYPDDEFSTTIDQAVPRWAGPQTLGYLPGLDGIRALSALAVVAYHLDFSWSAGGYLGVEVFFVLSGFLITRLMLDEKRRTGTLDRARFWLRRARRLLPAIVALVVGVCAWGAFVLPEGDLAAFRGDAIASLFYVQNWHAIITDQPYFQAFGRPSPLRHVWSLAIEEQFYLLWPLVLPWALHRLGRRWTVALIAVGIVASVAAMSATADITAPERAYYGTDTRAFGLLLGGLLAFGWQPERLRSLIRRTARRTVDAVGLVALTALAWQFVNRSEFDPWTYPEGFLLVDACTLALLVAATHPASTTSRLLGTRWLAALGRRSYSLYLWHWPVIVFTRPGRDWGLEGVHALVVRLLLIAALTELSYRFVEQPFRDGRVGRVAGAVSARIGVVAARRAAVATGTVSVIAFLAVLAIPSAAPLIEIGQAPIATTTTSTTAATTTTTTTTTAPPAQPEPTTTTAPSAPPAPAATAPEGVAEITVIGESVTLGAAHALSGVWGPRVRVDAVESRRSSDGIGRVEQLAAENQLSPTVFVHIGNNGAIPPGGFERIAAAAGPDRQVVLITVRVPRRWEAQVNGELRRVADAHEHVYVADWNAVANGEEGLLLDDGVHLTQAGTARYAELLATFRP